MNTGASLTGRDCIGGDASGRFTTELQEADPSVVEISGPESKQPGTQTCVHQNIVQHSKFEKTDLPTTELGTTC